MTLKGGWLLPVLALLAVTGCGKAVEQHPDWIIHSKLVFLAEGLGSEREPLPRTEFRLAFPYVAGDIYGAPTTGDFFNVVVGADYGFDIDLGRSHSALLASLEPTEFSLSYLRIEPATARVARLAPMVLQADGIDQLGRTDWFDPDSRRALLLLYLDRAATISGKGVAYGRPLRYRIQASGPGYVWVGLQAGADENVYTVTPKPARLELAVSPLAPSDRPQAASPTRTDTPAR